MQNSFAVLEGPKGTGKTTMLFDVVRSCLSRGEEPLVVVPENESFVLPLGDSEEPISEKCVVSTAESLKRRTGPVFVVNIDEIEEEVLEEVDRFDVRMVTHNRNDVNSQISECL